MSDDLKPADASAEGGGNKEPEASPEDRAREQGWRPKEEWTGPADKWKSAEDFLAVGERSAPVAAKRNATLEKQNAKLLAELTDIRTTMRDLVAGQKAERDRAVAAAITNLKAQKKVAVAEADQSRVDAIDDQLDELKTTPKAEPKEPERKADPDAEWSEDEKSWRKGNMWIVPNLGNGRPNPQYDPYMARTALGYYDLVEADPETADLDNVEKLKLVSAEMRRRFPEKFQNANRRAANAVEGGNGSSPRGNGKKSWSDLPPEAKAMGERLISQKVIKDRQSYVDQYPWG